MGERVRVVVAGTDDDVVAQRVARALRDSGMEVILTGGPQAAEQIVATVVQEDADAVVYTVYSPLLTRMLSEHDRGDVVEVLLGADADPAQVAATLRSDLFEGNAQR